MPISEVYNCDCMEFMATCKDKQFDLAIVDPDYGLNELISSGGTWASKYKKGDGDLGGVPKNEYFEQLFRISKNQIIWGANYFENMPSNRGFIIWDKKLTDNWTLAMCEYAFCSIEKPSKIFRASLSEGVQKEGDRIHICQKPIKLYKWLLKNYAKEGDTIFDSHLGSGSSRIACYDGGFDFVGCELDKDYFDAGNKRFEIFKSQQKLIFEK
jgi:site-specific DNA-methyltransferase (adenine-specific)